MNKTKNPESEVLEVFDKADDLSVRQRRSQSNDTCETFRKDDLQNVEFCVVESLQIPNMHVKLESDKKNQRNLLNFFRFNKSKSLDNELKMKKGLDLSCDATDKQKAYLFGRKNSQDAKIIKRSLSEEGKKHVHELVKYLQTEKPIASKKVGLGEDEIKLASSKDTSVDFDKYFEPKKKASEKMWKIPFDWYKKFIFSEENPSDLSDDKFKAVNRFGLGVSDGCNITLSFPSDLSDVAKFLNKTIEWDDIVNEADQVLSKFEFAKNHNIMARRGSLLQPRLLFVSPHPESGWDKVYQTANCLPLREWTSELFLGSKESGQLLDNETKQSLKWNASVEDFRHLLSPELSHFSSDINLIFQQIKRKYSVINVNPLLVNEEANFDGKAQQFRFRRNSFRDDVWTPKSMSSIKAKEYQNRLKLGQKDVRKVPVKKILSLDPNDILKAEDKKKSEVKKIKRRESNLKTDLPLDISIKDFAPKLVAKELTLIIKELILLIDRAEIITMMIRPHSINSESCPNITALLGLQKRIIQLFVTSILSSEDAVERAEIISHLIQVAQELSLLRNWHSIYSVISSLQSPPIARLKNTWHSVIRNHSDEYDVFVDLSQMIKKENQLLDYSPPAIMLFEDVVDQLKERCGMKLLEIKQHRLHAQWSQPTLAQWVSEEIRQLVDRAPGSGGQNKQDAQSENRRWVRKGIFKKIGKGRHKSSSVGSEASPDAQKANESPKNLTKGWRPASGWSWVDLQKLKPDEETAVLREMATRLAEYQQSMSLYRLVGSAPAIRDWLLLARYDSMNQNMNKSRTLEPAKR